MIEILSICRFFGYTIHTMDSRRKMRFVRCLLKLDLRDLDNGRTANLTMLLQKGRSLRRNTHAESRGQERPAFLGLLSCPLRRAVRSGFGDSPRTLACCGVSSFGPDAKNRWLCRICPVFSSRCANGISGRRTRREFGRIVQTRPVLLFPVSTHGARRSLPKAARKTMRMSDCPRRRPRSVAAVVSAVGNPA